MELHLKSHSNGNANIREIHVGISLCTKTIKVNISIQINYYQSQLVPQFLQIDSEEHFRRDGKICSIYKRQCDSFK